MKIRHTVATAVIAGLSAASLTGVATAAPTPAPAAQNAPATADEPAATTDAEEPGKEEPGKTEKPGETKKPGEPNEVVGSIADLLAYLPGLLPGDSEAAGSAEGAELPQDLEQLAGSASELLSSGNTTTTTEPSTGEGEADAGDATGQAEKPDAATSTAPSEDADQDSALGTDGADKPEGAERAGAQGAANGGGAAGAANGEGVEDADKVTVPAADTKPVSGDAKAAAERVIEEQETKAGHDLVEVNFVDDKTAFISLAESFDQQADADALKEIAQALHDNGFTVTAERSAK